MQTIRKRFIAVVVLSLLAAAVARVDALDAIPEYVPVSIGGMLREAYPTAGISAAAALNNDGDCVGRVIIDSQYHAFFHTQGRGVQLLPPLGGWTSHVAAEISDRDPVTGRVLIAGAAQTVYGDPDRAVLWVYDPAAGQTIEVVDIGVPAGADWSTATAVNNKGLVVVADVTCDGDGVCEVGEDCTTCPADCDGVTRGPRSRRYCCGNGVCESRENSSTCPVDCTVAAMCGDAVCDAGESSCDCPAACGQSALTETICNDGRDEDCDGFTDCADADCAGRKVCTCRPRGADCASDVDCCSRACRKGGRCR